MGTNKTNFFSLLRIVSIPRYVHLAYTLANLSDISGLNNKYGRSTNKLSGRLRGADKESRSPSQPQVVYQVNPCPY